VVGSTRPSQGSSPEHAVPKVMVTFVNGTQGGLLGGRSREAFDNQCSRCEHTESTKTRCFSGRVESARRAVRHGATSPAASRLPSGQMVLVYDTSSATYNYAASTRHRQTGVAPGGVLPDDVWN